MMIRYVKIFLLLCVGVWGLIGTFGNLAALGEAYSAVRDVTSMAGVPEGAGPPWATTNVVVVWIGVAVIVLSKIAALVGGGVGGIAMLRKVKAGPEAFAQSKQLAVAGCALAFGLLMFGFTFMAESTFFMFFDPQYQGAGALAFRFSASIALVALFVAQPEPG